MRQGSPWRRTGSDGENLGLLYSSSLSRDTRNKSSVCDVCEPEGAKVEDFQAGPFGESRGESLSAQQSWRLVRLC